MSAGTPQPLKVLLPIHPRLDALDFVGPLEMLSHAHFPAPSGSSQGPKAFHCTITASDAFTSSAQGVTFGRDIDIPEAHRRLLEFDVMVIPGGGTPGVLENGSELWPLFVPSQLCQNVRMGEFESCCRSVQARCSWLRRGC
jgi:hypothetical protein